MTCVSKFPAHLIELMKTSKYVHLATASLDCIPSVSLMNYTFISPNKNFNKVNKGNDEKDCYIIFATFKDTEKYENIVNNPTVSLLFHDWVTANNLSVRKNSLSQVNTPQNEPNSNNASSTTTTDNASNPPHPSKLLNLLQQLNQAELNEMSATIKGTAIPIISNEDESKYYKDLLLKANPDADVFINGDNVAIVKVKIESAKVTDNDNNIKVYE